jgi:hypothetical protein
MTTQDHRLPWFSVVWSALLILLIPLLVSTLVIFCYALVIGFQTRGDTAVINQSIASFTTSAAFLAFSALVACLVAFWRGWALANRVSEKGHIHILIAAGLAILIRIVSVIFFSSTNLGFVLPWLGLEIIGTLGAGYGGAYLVARRNQGK